MNIAEASEFQLSVRPPVSPKSIWWLVLATVLVTAYWCAGMQAMNHSLSYGDEGVVAEAARRIVLGQVPFRDYFTGGTPGVAYFYAAFLKMFGVTFFALRSGVLFTALAHLLASFWVLRRCGVRQLMPYLVVVSYAAYFTGPYWFIASHHWLSQALILASLVLLLGDRESACRRWQDMAAGGMATLGAFTLLHKGVIWLFAATIALWLTCPREERWARLRWFWAGALSIALPLCLAFLVEVRWDTLSYDLVVWPLTQYHKMEGHRGILLQYLAQNWDGLLTVWSYHKNLDDWLRAMAWTLTFGGNLVVHILPLLGVCALYCLWRRRAHTPEVLGCLAAFFVASYLSALHRLADTTLGFAALAAVIALALLLHDLLRSSPQSALSRWFAFGWVGYFVAVVLIQVASGAAAQKVTTLTPAGQVDSYLVGEAQTMEGVINYVQQRREAGDQVFGYAYIPIFNFLLQADNPTPYDTLVPPMYTQQQLDHAQALLESSRCRWVVWNYTPLEQTSFGRYLLNHYVVKARFKYAAVMERKKGSAGQGGGG